MNLLDPIEKAIASINSYQDLANRPDSELVDLVTLKARAEVAAHDLNNLRMGLDMLIAHQTPAIDVPLHELAEELSEEWQDAAPEGVGCAFLSIHATETRPIPLIPKMSHK